MDDTLNRISEYMKKHKIKKIELLTELGLDKSTWAAWARNDNTSYIKYLPQIAAYFNVSLDWLAGNEQKNKPTAERSELINNILTVCDGLPEDKQTELLQYAKYLAAKNK